MCMVSNVGDSYLDKFRPYIPYPQQPGLPHAPIGPSDPYHDPFKVFRTVTREEFDELRALVMQMREDLAKAIEYDRETNQPDCHNEDKYKILRAVAEALGVSLDDIIPPQKS